MDKEKAEYIVRLQKTHNEQIKRLKLKCFDLANKLKCVNSMDIISNQIINLVKTDVEREINELLELDKKALKDFLFLVFSDAKAWAGIAGFIAGIINGDYVFTTGAAISALSLFGSKAVQASKKRNETIRQSDYGLAYTLSKRYK